MSRVRASSLAIVLTAAGGMGCAARTPPPLDVPALVATRGAADTQFTLTARVIAEPNDVQARLALATLDDTAGRPGAALEQLEAVVALNGPFGTRWHADDRARLARLLSARARVRLTRGAASARRDLDRARGFGARVDADELARARAADAVAELRAVEAPRRHAGQSALGELATDPIADPSWRGARANATPEDRAAFGTWLWHAGARRAARDELEAWHAATAAPRPPALAAAYLDALVWWLPFSLGEVPPPPAADLVGDARCRFPHAPGCTVEEVITDAADATADERALALAPIGTPTRDPGEASAWAIVAVRAWLRGEGGLAAQLGAHVQVASFAGTSDAFTQLPAYARPLVARLSGRDQRVGAPATPDDYATSYATPAQRLVIATELALVGRGPREIIAMLGDAAATEPGRALLARVESAPLPHSDDPRADAAARAVVARLGTVAAAGLPGAPSLRAIAAGFRRDPGLADRLGRELVDACVDSALGNAAVGAMFDALGDPGRARHAWQAAVDASREPAFVRALAETEARAGDGDAALINGTAAAASSGDPAIVWVAVARALLASGRSAQAIDAAHRAMELAGPLELAAALDLAIVASRAMGRGEQADMLAAQRARLAPPLPAADAVTGPIGDADPTDIASALAAWHRRSDAGTLARLWVATRWNPRELAARIVLRAALSPGDPRHAAIESELVELAGDPDPAVGIDATQALR